MYPGWMSESKDMRRMNGSNILCGWVDGRIGKLDEGNCTNRWLSGHKNEH